MSAPGLGGPSCTGEPFAPGGRIAVVRLDGAGDVIMSEPVVQAVGERADEVVMVCAAPGAGAAALVGADRVCVTDAPWVALDPQPADRPALERIVESWRAEQLDAALVLTSFHQSPLPAATLLKLAGVARVAGLSADHPGALLDVRCRVAHGHQVRRNATVARAAGYPVAARGPRVNPPELPSALDRLASRQPILVHPGASVAARGMPVMLARRTVEVLVETGAVVALTGTADETAPLSDLVDDRFVFDLGGATPWRDLAALVAAARAVVCGNTAMGHLAAALGTPVVSIFAPTVDPQDWHPWGDAVALLGDHEIACAGCRARSCPWGAPICVDGLGPHDVVHALDRLGVAAADGLRDPMGAAT